MRKYLLNLLLLFLLLPKLPAGAQSQTPRIPPKVLEQIARTRQIAPVSSGPELISPAGRVLLGLAGLALIAGATLICGHQSWSISKDNFKLILGLCGSWAALSMAVALQGHYYIHLAPALCSTLTGVFNRCFACLSYGRFAPGKFWKCQFRRLK